MKFSQRNFIILLVVFALIIGITPVAKSWLPCDVAYVFMGKTRGDTCTMAFMSVASGECDSWSIYYLTLGPQKLIAEKKVLIQGSPSIQVWDKSLVVGDYLDWMYYLWPVNGNFITNHSQDKISAPPFDSAFERVWLDCRGDYDQKKSLKDSHFDPPNFNREVKLLWRAPGGLYKNYQIAEVIISGRYAFIRTQAQVFIASESFYNGLLIYLLQ